MAATYGTRTDDIAHRSKTQEAYDQVISVQNNRAVQVVAAQASGLEDCLELLAMLGLDAQAAQVAHVAEVARAAQAGQPPQLAHVARAQVAQAIRPM